MILEVGMSPETAAERMVKHLAVTGEVYRGDVNIIIGSAGYANVLLARNTDLFHVTGVGKVKSVRLREWSQTSGNPTRLQTVMDTIDHRMWHTWNRDMRNTRLSADVTERERAFRLSRLVHEFRLLGIWIDTYNRPLLLQHGKESRIMPNCFYTAREVKRSKGKYNSDTGEKGSLEIAGSRISGLLVTGQVPYIAYDFDGLPEETVWKTRTEERLRIFADKLLEEHGFGENTVMKTLLCGLDKEKDSRELLRRMTQLIPSTYKNIFLLPHNLVEAKPMIEIISTPSFTKKLSLIFFDKEDIISDQIALNAISKGMKYYIGLCPDLRAISIIRKKQSDETYTVYAFPHQVEFYQKVFFGTSNIFVSTVDESTVLQKLRDTEPDNEENHAPDL